MKHWKNLKVERDGFVYFLIQTRTWGILSALVDATCKSTLVCFKDAAHVHAVCTAAWSWFAIASLLVKFSSFGAAKHVVLYLRGTIPASLC